MSELNQQKTGVREVKALFRPNKKSHKGDNGAIIIIGGSEKFHGAPILAAKTASRIVDLVYFSSVLENNEIIKKLKSQLSDFIVVPRSEIGKVAGKVDAILIGPGLGISQETKRLTNSLLKRFKNKKFVLDADALKVVDKKLLNQNCIITPHHQEFKQLFGLKATKAAVSQMAKKYHCVIVLKGQLDLIAWGNKFKINKTGNAGMTKGGTGDVLAGLITGLAAKNELFLAASAGTFINGLAGDQLYKKVSFYYNASDLAEEIPKTIKWCLNS
ncbi:MAG: NAD(P)H-hydrate dehydratase [Patescibacteria group bacterium]|jgi:NAD(P)H-hydrate epimerase